MRRKTVRVWAQQSLVVAAALCLLASASGQRTQSEPATDSSAQASPIRPMPAAPAVDSSAQASPIGSGIRGGAYVAPHTAIEVRLARAIDSGHLKNGDTVHATLANGVALTPRGILNAGTPAQLTVVETLPAGRISAAGEFSLQLVHVGAVPVYTDTLTYRGKPGHRDVADSAPQVGTDAGLPVGAELTFHVLPPPGPANAPPRARNRGPGSVDGVAVGGPPPPGSSTQPSANRRTQNASGKTLSSQPGSGKTNSSQARSVTSGGNTPQPAQPAGKNSPAPNQPSPPANANPTDSAQPHS